MKTYFAFLCLLLSAGLARGVTTSKADPDKPWRYAAEDHLVSGYHVTAWGDNLLTGEWLDTMQRRGYWHDWYEGRAGRGKAFQRNSGSVSGDGYSDSWDEVCHTTLTWLADGTGTALDDCSASGVPVAVGRPFDNPRHWEHQYAGSAPWVSATSVGGTEWSYLMRAQTKMKLFTGGKARAGRKNLFVLTASATGHANLYYPEIDYLPVTYPIANNAIVLGDLGPLGSDGVLYKALGDGETHPITPTVAGSKYYRYNQPGATPYIPVIKASNIPLDPEKPNVEFCVGQKVTFNLAWNSTPPGLTSESGWDWYISAKCVNTNWYRKQFVPSTDPYLPGEWVNYGSQLYANIREYWQVAQPYAWWISGGIKNARLDETLTFANGQTAKISAQGKFKMFRPSVTMVNAAVHGTPQNIWLTGPPPWTGLEFGRIGLGHQSGPNNMSYEVRVISSDFAGEAKITQLCTIDATHYPLDINISNQLDNQDPYPNAFNPNIYQNPNPQGSINIVWLDDAPQNAGFGHFHFNGSFVDYIMFTPGGAGDIYVTLGKVTWGTSFGASYPSATIDPNTVTGPTDPDGSDDFPDWTDVWSNPN